MARKTAKIYGAFDTISRYDRKVSEITMRPNASAVAAGKAYQVLSYERTENNTIIIRCMTVLCKSNDNDVIMYIGSYDGALDHYQNLLYGTPIPQHGQESGGIYGHNVLEDRADDPAWEPYR